MTEAYLKSRELLIKLHDLMRAGKCDLEEADLVRDEMDAPWYAMTDEEQKAIRDLSIELYTAQPSEEKAEFLTVS